jgi:hypothetical protein
MHDVLALPAIAEGSILEPTSALTLFIQFISASAFHSMSIERPASPEEHS